MLWTLSILFFILDLTTAMAIAWFVVHYQVNYFERILKAAFILALMVHAADQIQLMANQAQPRTYSWVPLMLMLHVNTHLYIRSRRKQLPTRGSSCNMPVD